jgi:serine/threonine-protein phosphatase 2A regulatory subunit B
MCARKSWRYRTPNTCLLNSLPSQEPEDAASKSFFSEIVASISDARSALSCLSSPRINSLYCFSFASDGRYVISRDYLTLKIWDTHMESRPVRVTDTPLLSFSADLRQVININESLRSMLCELYESDFIFDKFEISLQGTGGGILTGGYG